MGCLDFNEFKKFILQFDQNVPINKETDKNLRYNVWETTSKEVRELLSSLSTNVLSDENQSSRVLDKLKGSLKIIRNSAAKGGAIQEDVFDHKFNVEMSIALHEMMESVKGESDKSRNEGIDITSISNTGVLPALPLSRVAASIGRKIAFQKGYRFKRATNEDTAARIEALYYDLGKEALVQLQKKGYVQIDENISTIMDYQNKKDMKKDFPKNSPTRSDVMSVSLNEKKLGIKVNTEESAYFLNRTSANLDDTDLGVITEKLRSANMILQPSTVVLPNTDSTITAEELARWDDGIKEPDPKTAKARKLLHKNPVRVHKSLHGLMQLFNAETKSTGKSASKIVTKIFGARKNMVRSLFGLKRSDNYSIDKKESVKGQNLSKTTPLDDVAEYYDMLEVDGNPSPLHMALKIGRNARLYYLNSVLNAHGSKQSRYMLTPGEYTVDAGSLDYAYLVYQVAQSLKLPDSYSEVVEGGSLDQALAIYDAYLSATTIKAKLHALGGLAKEFTDIDYVTIVTSLQAIKDIRNPVNGKITTEFAAASDATASGGTLTFIQALGTNPKVTEFLQRIGLLNPTDLVEKNLDDIYGLMTEAIDNFLTDKPGAGLGPDIGSEDVKGILQDTLDMLFIKSEDTRNKDVRTFSKSPVMTFIYNQGRNSSIETMARSLADVAIDSLDNAKTREYLTKLFNDPEYSQRDGAALKDEKDLYKKIVDELKKRDLPGNIYDIMQDNIKDEFLTEYSARGEEVYEIVKQLPADKPFKILPAGAVMSGKKASTPGDLETYGMPITKEVEVLNTFDGKPDTVLTRREKLHKPVMDVSTIHGTDAAPLYHSLVDVNPKDGVVVVHDEVRGSVQTVRAVEKQYPKTVKDMAMQYDIHQQIMEAVAAQSPEIAASAEFKSLKARIDKDVAEKQRIISELFNENTDALIGDGKKFEDFAAGAVDTKVETKVKSPDAEPATPVDQDFGDATVTITEDGVSEEVVVQEYWNSLKDRLAIVERLKLCLKK